MVIIDAFAQVVDLAAVRSISRLQHWRVYCYGFQDVAFDDSIEFWIDFDTEPTFGSASGPIAERSRMTVHHRVPVRSLNDWHNGRFHEAALRALRLVDLQELYEARRQVRVLRDLEATHTALNSRFIHVPLLSPQAGVVQSVTTDELIEPASRNMLAPSLLHMLADAERHFEVVHGDLCRRVHGLAGRWFSASQWRGLHNPRVYTEQMMYPVGYSPQPARWDPQAVERGWALLRENLDPDQRAEFEAYRHFHCVGGTTGIIYRICEGTQQNVITCDNNGRANNGLCFLPEGDLVVGDVMLSQKIALELNEKEALRVGRGFNPAYAGRSAADVRIPKERLEQLLRAGGNKSMTATEVSARRREPPLDWAGDWWML